MIITLIPGDGIGPEVTRAVVRILEAAGFTPQWESFSAGAEAVKEHGTTLPQPLLDSITRNKIALKGPITTPIGKGFTSVNVGLRKALDLFSNLRPVKNLTDDDQVDALEAAVDAGEVPDRPQVGEQIERLAQADVHAGEAFADRRRHRALQRDLVLLDRIEELRRERLAEPLEGDDAGVLAIPVDLHAGRGDDPDDRGADFRSDAVAGYESDCVNHEFDLCVC